MKVNDNFVLLKSKKYSKYKLVYNELRHKKTGARIVWIKNKDRDRFFAIEFATFPQDNTGSPHILEHSVLHGSDKYPIFGHDLFAMLVRRRQLSNINAYTNSDKTTYIFSAINEDDFINTLDVYLDAVFNPSVLHEKNIFRQEGWRIEKSNGNYKYNGVVLNEMLASHGSYDTRLFKGIYSCVLRENPIYTKQSGGDPNYIVDLKYEKFIEFYKKFYGAANAIIYLYGDISEQVFDKIDEYLNKARKGRYFRQTIKFPRKQYTKTEYIKGEENKDSAFAVAFPSFYVEDLKSNLAVEIILQSISYFSSDPLRKVFEDSDLVQDFGFHYETEYPINFAVVYFKHIDSSNFSKLDNMLSRSLEEISAKGIDKSRIKMQLRKTEFILEKLIHNTSLGEVIFEELSKFWRRGEACDLFEFSSYIKELKNELKYNPDYFDKIFNKVFLKNKYVQKFKLKAKKDYEEYRKLQIKQEKLNKLSKSSKIKIEKQIKEFQEFKQHKDDLSIINASNLREISKSNLLRDSLDKLNIFNIGNTKFILNYVNSKVSKHQILFNLSHLSLEELQKASVIVSALDRFDARNLKRNELDYKISKHLPYFSKDILVKNVGKNQVFLHIDLEFLKDNITNVRELVEIYINDLILSEKVLESQLLELQSNLKTSIRSWRSAFKLVDCLSNASMSKEASLTDSIQGFSFLKFIDKEIENFDINAYINVYKKLFIGGIDYVLTSSNTEDNILTSLKVHSKHSRDKNMLRKDVRLRDLDDEIILIDGLGANINSLAFSYNSRDYFLLKYLSMLLNYNYLWENIRVKGGAYGAYILVNFPTSASFTSFNDPNIEKTYEYFIRSLSEAFDSISNEDFVGAKARTLLYFDQPKSSWDLPMYMFDVLTNYKDVDELIKEKTV